MKDILENLSILEHSFGSCIGGEGWIENTEDGVIESITASDTSERSQTSQEEVSSIKILIDRCHELHRRNEILINRKLEAVKGALASLREGSATDDVEVYTKAGGLAKPKYNTPIKKT